MSQGAVFWEHNVQNKFPLLFKAFFEEVVKACYSQPLMLPYCEETSYAYLSMAYEYYSKFQAVHVTQVIQILSDTRGEVAMMIRTEMKESYKVGLLGAQ